MLILLRLNSLVSLCYIVILSQVTVNVYDLIENNQYLHPWGFGAYHSGIQLGSVEYTFAGGSGIFFMEPKQAPGAIFRQSIEMGYYEGTSRQLECVINDLRIEFDGASYNILNKNCNHFADALVQKLLNKPLPPFINRLANVGSYFSCILPPSVTGAAPVNDPNSSTYSGTDSSSGYQVIAPPGQVRNPILPSKEVFSKSGMKLG